VEDLDMKKLLLLIALSVVALGCDSVTPPVEEEEGELIVEAIEIQLTWDNEADLDLWVTDPSGERTWYNNPNSSSGGTLSSDDTDGQGPEIITWPAGVAPTGRYIVEVNHFEGPSPSNYIVRVSYGDNSETFSGVVSAEETRAVAELTISDPADSNNAVTVSGINVSETGSGIDVPEPEAVEVLKVALTN
jgi:hypothetical protein